MLSTNIITLSQLNSAETLELKKLLKDIESSEAKNIMAAIEEIKKFPPPKLFKFSENNVLFKKFCEDNPSLNYLWQVFLEMKGYPNFIIMTLDNKKMIPFRLWMGAFLVSQVNDSSIDISLLNKACEYGLFSALAKRLDLNCKLFANPAFLKHRKIITENILADCKQLGNIYRTVGFVEVAITLQNLTTALASKKNEDAALASPFFEAALENLFMGEALEKDSISQQIAKILYQNKSLAEHHGITKWSDAIAKINGEAKFSREQLIAIKSNAEKRLTSEAKETPKKS